MFHYGGVVATAIQRLKFSKASYLCAVFGPFLREHLDAFPEIELVIPVPLHPKRLVERGYNQAALLARSTTQGTRLPVEYDALKRIRKTFHQATLSRQERYANVENAFEATPRLVKGKSILLIDDVMTTGATVSACADALLFAEAQEVNVLTLARTLD